MKPTQFMVHACVPGTDQTALFNTLTSSLVIVENDLFEEIVLRRNYEQHLNEVEQLRKMGFLVEDSIDEAFQIQELRNSFQYSARTLTGVIIAPTLECNAHCAYCYENGFRSGTMTTEVADALVSFITKHAGNSLPIQWFGGEPLLAVDMIDYISRRLVESGIMISSLITTNGLLITEDVLSKAKEVWRLRRFQIPIDGIGSDYGALKRYGGISYEEAFKTVIQNVHLVLDSGFFVNARVNFDPGNPGKAAEIMDYLSNEFGTYGNFFAYPAPLTGPGFKSVVSDFDADEQNPYLSLLRKSLQNGYDCPGLLKEDSFYDGDEALSGLSLASRPCACYATTMRTFAIDPKGDLYKCHRHLGRGRQYTCGNVFEGPKYSHAASRLSSSVYCYDECASCALLPICQGGCKVKMEADKTESDRNGCLSIKAFIEEAVLMYLNQKMG